jgi:hypothetical protein
MKNRLNALTSRSGLAFLLMSTAALFPATSNATIQPDSFAIMFLDELYYTELSTRVTSRVPPYVTSTQTLSAQSDTPLENELIGSPKTFAKAQADMFSVSAATSAYWDSEVSSAGARAAAGTVLTFTTLRDELGSMTLDFAVDGLYRYTSGSVNLYDRTFNQSVFSYGWERHGASSIPGFDPNGFGPPSFSLAVSPQLYASHVYEMSLRVGSDAQDDSQGASIRVSGMQPVMTPVPEPESYAMGMVGFGLLWLMMRRRKAPTASQDALSSSGCAIPA